MELHSCFFQRFGQHLNSFGRILAHYYSYVDLKLMVDVVNSSQPLHVEVNHQVVHLVHGPFPTFLPFQEAEFIDLLLASLLPYLTVKSFQAPNSINYLFHFTKFVIPFASYLVFIQPFMDWVRMEQLHSHHCLDLLKMAFLNGPNHVTEFVILVTTL